jgi:hypothetical protein
MFGEVEELKKVGMRRKEGDGGGPAEIPESEFIDNLEREIDNLQLHTPTLLQLSGCGLEEGGTGVRSEEVKKPKKEKKGSRGKDWKIR